MTGEWWREAGARADAATPGPWTHDPTDASVGPDFTIYDGDPYPGAVAHCVDTYADAEFIAAARVDVPRMAATLDAVAARHTPIEIEVEQWHDPDAECKAEGACPDDGECGGHIVTIKSCVECGVGFDSYGEPVQFKWPCATAAALGAGGTEPKPKPRRTSQGPM